MKPDSLANPLDLTFLLWYNDN